MYTLFVHHLIEFGLKMYKERERAYRYVHIVCVYVCVYTVLSLYIYAYQLEREREREKCIMHMMEPVQKKKQNEPSPIFPQPTK